MQQLLQTIPDAELLLALEAEELAGQLLTMLKARFPTEQFHPYNLSGELFPRSSTGPLYDAKYESEIKLAYWEAWAWLENNGLIIRSPQNGSDGWMVLSRKARRLEGTADFTNFLAARSFRKELLHPSIADQVWLSFIRGNYPTAVFESMRAVEIAVREAAGFARRELGVPMIRRAFNSQAGPLTDMRSEESEREALMALFAGAIGSYKNPHSHRNVPLDDPAEVMEMIYLASHLLRIVDSRRAQTTASEGD